MSTITKKESRLKKKVLKEELRAVRPGVLAIAQKLVRPRPRFIPRFMWRPLVSIFVTYDPHD